MGYGVNNQWESLRGRARAAGSSRARRTRTGKHRRSGSARRARKSGSLTHKRRSLLEKSQSRYIEKPEGSGHIWDTKAARFVGWS